MELRKEDDKITNNIVKRMTALLLICMLMASMAVTAFADVKDEFYYKSSVTTQFTKIPDRYKENNSKVYVDTRNSSSVRTKVQTWCKVGGYEVNKTGRGTVVLDGEKKYAITNYVYENGDYTTGKGVNMWLKIASYSGTHTHCGYWSPDWTGTGTGITIM